MGLGNVFVISELNSATLFSWRFKGCGYSMSWVGVIPLSCMLLLVCSSSVLGSSSLISQIDLLQTVIPAVDQGAAPCDVTQRTVSSNTPNAILPQQPDLQFDYTGSLHSGGYVAFVSNSSNCTQAASMASATNTGPLQTNSINVECTNTAGSPRSTHWPRNLFTLPDSTLLEASPTSYRLCVLDATSNEWLDTQLTVQVIALLFICVLLPIY